MIYKWILTWILVLPFVLEATAQKNLKDTVITLEDIEVRTSRLKNFALGTTIDRIEPMDIQKNNSLFLSDLFSSTTGITVKSYGINGLATMSIRGGTAAQTAVLWNGLNIQSPMSGVADISMIPSYLVNNIAIQQGGSGTLYGSGAIGGVIHISTTENFHQPNNISFRAGYGSFDKQDYLFSSKTGDEHYMFNLKIFMQSAQNDFSFTNTAKIGSPLEKQTNARMRDYGFMPGLQVITSKNSVLNFSALYQKFSKDIPTIMTDALTNQDNQGEVNLLVTAGWKYTSPGYSLNVRSGIIRNKITMIDNSLPDPEGSPTAIDLAGSVINEIESKIFITKSQILDAGINFTHESGESVGYFDNITRNRLSFFTSYKVVNLLKGLNTALSFRKEIEKKWIQPFTYSLGSDYQLTPYLSFKGNVSKNYRIPTINDLYWPNDGYEKGNPNLQPESGYSGEAGFVEKINASVIKFEFAQSGFANNMNNMIVWIAGPERIYTPVNKTRGRTKGVELRVKGNYSEGNSTIGLNGFYSWTKSRLTSNDIYNNQPLLYTPDNRLMASINYAFRALSVYFNFNYTGKRYYDAVNTLPAYQLGNLVFNIDIPAWGNKLSTSFSINNIWNTEYQAVAWYAMPMRNYLLTLNLKINTVY